MPAAFPTALDLLLRTNRARPAGARTSFGLPPRANFAHRGEALRNARRGGVNDELHDEALYVVAAEGMKRWFYRKSSARRTDCVPTTRVSATGGSGTRDRRLLDLGASAMVSRSPRLRPLAATEVCRRCDPSSLPFETTDQLEPLEGTLGQDRALEALVFAMELKAHDFNVFAFGPPGVGKREAVRALLAAKAKDEPRAQDWCYVPRFSDPQRPRCIAFPAGRGRSFRDQVQAFASRVATALAAATTHSDVEAGVAKLAAEARAAWNDLPAAASFFDDLAKEVIESAPPGPRAGEEGEAFDLEGRSEVNLLVDHSASEGAPVVYEDHPTLLNLIGRLEHVSVQGMLVTHLGLIRAGALHRANGGYLIIDAIRLLEEPFAYDALKRALRGRALQLEDVGESPGSITTQTLEPEPIPLSVRVVLVGDQRLHAQLSDLDPDFGDLFKVPAEFGAELEWTPDTARLYPRLLAAILRRHRLLRLDRTGVARVMEHAARRAGHRSKLSVELRDLADLLREADHVARSADASQISRAEIDRAIAARIRRADSPRERAYEQIRRGAIAIATRGEEVGQVNAISVIDLGSFAFGRPSRITARTRLGEDGVVDIEREVELGGALHSKGVLILSGFIGGRYARELPLSLSASLVFEQSYGGVEGDSASCAELCALLSSLAEAPLAQSLAVAGSVDQLGRVQAIGAVNEKVEGFFDVCREGGLTGEQGVLIPRANLENLLLRPDVVAAVQEGRFFLYPIESVDDAIELLTGVPSSAIHERVERKLRVYAGAVRTAVKEAR